MSIGIRIKELRVSKNLTQKQLAKKLNVTDKAVSKWEQEAGDPSISSLRDISAFFGISLDELINGVKEDYTNDTTILERIVLKDSTTYVQEMIAKGVKLDTVDEFGNDIVDYCIRHKKAVVLDTLIENKVLQLRNGFFTINTSKSTRKWFNDEIYNVMKGSYYRTKGIHYSQRHQELFELLIHTRQYDLIKKCLYIREELPSGRGGNSYPMYIGLGRKDFDLSDEMLKLIASSNDKKLISILVGFDDVVHPKFYQRLADSISISSNEETKQWFIVKLLEFNVKSRDHNKNLYELETRRFANKVVQTRTRKDQNKIYYTRTVLKISKWMVIVALSNEELMKKIAPSITDDVIDKDIMTQISKKHSLEMFSDSLGYKLSVKAELIEGKEFSEFVDSCYQGDYNKFPINEIMRKLKNHPEFERDVIHYAYYYKGARKPYHVENLKFQINTRNRLKKSDFKFKMRNAGSGLVLVYNSPDWIKDRKVPVPKKDYSGYVTLNVKHEDLFYNIVKYCSQETVEITNELFSLQEKKLAIEKLISNKEVPLIKKLIAAENNTIEKYTYYKILPPSHISAKNAKYFKSISTSNALQTLSKNKDVLSEIVELIDITDLDILLNSHTDDKDFEQMALLIDHGAMLYSSYMTVEDDGWGYDIDVMKSEKDPKKTAVMREMIKQIIGR